MSQRADRGRCAEILELLDAWIDGDLDEVEAAAVRAHVDECGSCHEELKLAETVVAELRALPELDVPEGVLQTVRRKTQPTPARRVRAFIDDVVSRPVPALAAIAAVVLLVLLLSPWRPPNRNTPIRRSHRRPQRPGWRLRMSGGSLSGRSCESNKGFSMMELRRGPYAASGVRCSS